MKVFISWSGTRSQKVAKALSEWIKLLIPSADPWLSTEMDRGVKWLNVIGESLDQHDIGILCVTPGNVDAPWINFEAGALSKHLDDKVRVIPYLLDFRSLNDLKPPLGQFNSSLADEEGTWTLIRTLNGLAEHQHTDANLQQLFRTFWPKLEEQLGEISRSGIGTALPARRSADSKIDEILEIARRIQSALDKPAAIPLPTAVPPSVNEDLASWLEHQAPYKLAEDDYKRFLSDPRLKDSLVLLAASQLRQGATPPEEQGE